MTGGTGTATTTSSVPLRRNRDFTLLWLGESASELGTAMSVLVLPLIGYAITGSPAKAALAGTAALLATVVLRLPAGALADRWPRNRVLIAAHTVAALCYGSLAAAALAHHLTLVHLILAAAGGGGAEAFAAPASSAAIRTVVPAEQRPAAYSALQIRTHGAQLAGPPLGGVLYSLARGVPFAVDAVSYLACALSVRALRTPLPAPPPSGGSVLADMREGMRFVARQRIVRALMLWGAIVNLGGLLAFVAVTLRLVRAGVHPFAIGLVDSAGAVAGILGALVAPRVIAGIRTGVLTVVTGVVAAGSAALTSISDDPVVVGVFVALATVVLPANNAGISAFIANVVPDRLQGRVNAAAGVLAGGLTPLGPLLAGVLVGSVGGTAATLTGAAVLLVSLLPLLAVAEVRTLGRPADWPAAAGEDAASQEAA